MCQLHISVSRRSTVLEPHPMPKEASWRLNQPAVHDSLADEADGLKSYSNCWYGPAVLLSKKSPEKY
jgi:hypothetical protein